MPRCNGCETSNEDSNKIKKVGNIVGAGKSQGGSVYMTQGICPNLIAGMTHGNTVPYLIEVKKI